MGGTRVAMPFVKYLQCRRLLTTLEECPGVAFFELLNFPELMHDGLINEQFANVLVPHLDY